MGVSYWVFGSASWALGGAVASAASPHPAFIQNQPPDKIGIFDLKAIHAVPLDPEVLSKTKQGDVVIEQVRFTTVPGVRMVASLTYKEGAKAAPGYAFVELFPTKPLVAEADSGFFGIVLQPPTGNTNPAKLESVGGPVYGPPFDFNAQFSEDKNQSYIYQYTVGLIRCFDYVATRPEANISAAAVIGYSWASTMVGLMHAIDDRPAAYITFHFPGYYVDSQGLSAGAPIPLGPGKTLTRKQYEMYCPAAYAGFGSKPLYDGTALDDSYTRLDAIMEIYSHLKGPKAFAFIPNRQHAPTSRNELNGYSWWLSHWVFGGPEPPTVGEGTVKATGGKLVYTCAVNSTEPLVHAELLISYGKAGNWLGRTWHRIPLTAQSGSYSCEVPVYNPQIPFYAAAQIETAKFSAVANGPQFIAPSALGATTSNAVYGNSLFDPSQKDDLYIRTGNIVWSADGPNGGGSAVVSPGPENTICFQNIDGDLWAGKTSLSIWLKGDGKLGPIRAYLVYNPNYYLELDRNNFTSFDLVTTGATFAASWHEYSIPLNKVKNLDQVSTLFFDSQKRKLQIGPILLK